MTCIKAKTMYTGKEVLREACLVLDGECIAGISSQEQGQVLQECQVLTPAFVDPHSHIGLVRSGEPESESEANDKQDPFLVLADPLDSLQMDDPALQEAVQSGVLYSCLLPGSGNIIGGSSAVVRNYAQDSSQALISRAGIKAAFGYNPMSTSSWSGTRPSTRMGALAQLRAKLDSAARKQKRYKEADQDKRKEITFTAEEETLLQILEGSLGLRVHVHKVDDVSSLLRLVREYGLQVSVEHALAVDKPHIFAELARLKIPVCYGPLDAFAYKVELRQEDWRNAKYLLDSGARFGLMSDHPVTLARQLLLQTRWFLRLGLSKQQAIEILSRKNAELLGLQDVLGTLEQGKWASFVCWSGDPFDLASYPTAVYGEGKLLYSQAED
ncbi:MAG: amidohydrolase family protein [Desulfohalobiaceae bacterium]